MPAPSSQPDAQAGDEPAVPPLPKNAERITLIGIVVLFSFIAFDTLGVATAMPAIATDLRAGDGYALAFSMFIVGMLAGQGVSGGWCDRSGPAPAMGSGGVLFVLGMVGCALAPTFPMLLLARGLSGVGAGMISVAVYVLIAAVYPEHRRPTVFAWVSAAWVLPALVGPAVAGWLAEQVTWRAVFWIGVPFAGLAGAVLLPVAVRAGRARTEAGESADLRRVGHALVVAVAAGALSWAAQAQAATPVRVVVGVAAVAAVGAALPRLVPVGTLRLRRGLPSVIACRGLVSGAYFGAEAYIPLALHSQRGMGLTAAGLALTAAAIGWSFGAAVQSRDRRQGVERAGLLVAGACLVAVGVVLLPLLMLDAVTPWAAVGIWAFAAMGMGLAIATQSLLVMALSEPGQEGRNGAALNLCDGLGSTMGVAIAGAVYAAGFGYGHDREVFALLWACMAVVAVGGMLVARRARPRAGGSAGAAA